MSHASAGRAMERGLCQRARGLGPKARIVRRVARAAHLQLERPSLSIQQFAALLGISSAQQFCRFFQRISGGAPGQCRRRCKDRRAASENAAAGHYKSP